MQSAKIDEKRREIENLKDFNNDNNRKIAVYKNDIAHISDDTKRIKDEIKHTDTSNTDLNNKIDEKKGKIEWHEKYIKEKSSELGANSNRLKEVEDSIGRFSEESRGYSEKLSAISRERSERNLEYVTSNSSITEINNRLETIKKEITEKNNDIKETVSALSDYESMESELEIKLESAKNALNGFKMRLESKKNKKEAAKINFDKLNLDRDECERRARLLEDLERNLEGFQKSVKVVLQESSRGRLRGINGPISRLFKTSPDYNIAIETALGAAMQNIVVETSYDAKQAIKYLKQNNAGRCTFLPLDTIKGRELEEGSLEDQFGFVGIASKLCSYDKKYHEVITSLLGRIVVAEDLDSAAGIAKKYLYKFRVVTLDGQVVNAGGSMTGGSSIRNSGLLSRMSEIEKIKKRAQELNKNALDAKEEYKILEQETAKAEAELLAANAEFSNASKEKINIEAQIKIFKTKKASQAETLEAIGREEKNISLRLAELNSRKDKAMAECDKLDVQIKSLELKVSSIMGNKNGLTEKREQIGKKIQDIKIEILSAEKDIESLKFEIASIENQKKDKDGRIENLNLEIKNNEYKIELADQKIKSLSEESKNKSSVIKEKEKEILNLNIQKQELERASIDIRKKEQESLSTRETIGRELARLEERKESLKANYDDIIRRLWEEYELTRREAEEIGSNIKSVSESQKELKIIKFKIKNLGSVNLGAVEEYEEVSERYNFMSEQVEDVEESRKELLKLINDLTSQMKDIFSARFREINENFGSTFRELFGGGSARLLISDPNDILNSGIEIEVQPEGKLISRLESLSGGEKALVAISLYFAIMKVSPAPFCILDEIEAALDDVNVDRFAAYLRRMNKNTQFIAITHRRGTMEGSDALYGVTMQDEGISKILSLDIENAVIEKNAS
jgi:chromosome segregation protein